MNASKGHLAQSIGTVKEKKVKWESSSFFHTPAASHIFITSKGHIKSSGTCVFEEQRHCSTIKPVSWFNVVAEQTQ